MAKNRSSTFGVADGFFDITPESKDKVKEDVIEVKLSDLHTFKNHPFKVNDDEKMQETVESIKEHGVLVPGIVRKSTNGYEIISGHRRRRACELAGLETMPVFVRDLSDDEAIIVMVDSNIQREEILPSEKAKAYKMRYDAMKHQGKADGNGKSLDQMSEETGDSRATIQRLISIADLNSALLQLIDDKKMGLAQGVDLAALSEEEQEKVAEVINETSIIPSMVQSAKIKDLSKQHSFDILKVREILIGKPTPARRKFTIKDQKLKEYFPEEYTSEQIEEVVFKLLDEWKASQE